MTRNVAVGIRQRMNRTVIVDQTRKDHGFFTNDGDGSSFDGSVKKEEDGEKKDLDKLLGIKPQGTGIIDQELYDK
jgi:hypothetical protein